MRPMNMKNATFKLFLTLMVVATLFLVPVSYAAAPGISGTTFNLTAQQAFLNMPDGNAVYSWGYGCASTTGLTFLPAAISGSCPTMQVPGPTMIVTEGQSITVNLTNNLPAAAGNTSILFPGFALTSTCPNSATVPQGLLACEAAPGATVTYTFTASAPGTHAYYSGTQGDLQVEMGLYGAVIVLPATIPANCTSGYHALNSIAKSYWGEPDYRLTNATGGKGAAYDHPGSCYDREYLFQWATMDARVHKQALAEVTATTASGVCVVAGVVTPNNPGCSLDVQTEPYHPAYFVINGRSMPDLMDPNYASEYPHQPYNGNPHTHPGELMLIRTIGQGRWEHPFHEHANHVRILARDGNLQLSSNSTPILYSSGLTGDSGVSASGLAGLLMFNTDTTPGEAFDGIFYYTGRGLNWDPYGHHPPIGGAANAGLAAGDAYGDPLATLPCTPDVNGYNSSAPTAVNFMEWCQDHDKPVQVSPFGDVSGGGPATFPDPNVFTNGPWYGGTPYLGPDAVLRSSHPACATGQTSGTVAVPEPNCTDLQPSNVQANPPNERGWAFMWHSHNEREITTNNVFPGGMLMMLLVDSREFVIDESL
jgi:FtsP/CotA-like multicopper oxidase with cupredoxin domain